MLPHAEDDRLSYTSDDDDRLSYASYDNDQREVLPPPPHPGTRQDPHPPLSTPHSKTMGGPGHDHNPTIRWDESTFQDKRMSCLGIAVHTELHIVTCVTCRSVIDPDKLHAHIAKHVPKDSIPTGYQDELQDKFSLIPKKELRIPGTVRQAIPNLPLYPGVPHCPKCGYAAFDHGTVRKHDACGPIKPDVGYAQAYYPNANRGFFAVTVPEPSPPEPDANLVEILKRKYPDPIPSQRPVAIPKATCDANAFLKKEGWGIVVDGLTGEDIWKAVRTCDLDLRKAIAESVKKHMETVNSAISKAGMHAIGVAIGSYHGYV